MSISTLLTIGYQGHDLASFIAQLKAARVDVLADIRLTPISRKKGFSKTKLGDALLAAGITYEHLKILGNPKEIRKAARSVEECLDMYRAHMDGEWQERLERLEELASEKRVAIMCMEEDHHTCHRSIVAEAVARRYGAEIINL